MCSSEVLGLVGMNEEPMVEREDWCACPCVDNGEAGLWWGRGETGVLVTVGSGDLGLGLVLVGTVLICPAEGRAEGKA